MLGKLSQGCVKLKFPCGQNSLSWQLQFYEGLLLHCHFTAQLWEECTSSDAKEEIPAYVHTNNSAVHIHEEVDSTLSLFLRYSLTEG